MKITPQEFLETIYGPDAAASNVWTCGFANFPGNWTGAMGFGHLSRLHPERANYYFCIGEMDERAPRRNNSDVIRQRVIIADDIGTKADKSVWDAKLAAGFPQPTFKIETSPGNETWGWVLDKPIERSDVEDWAALALIRAHMGDMELTDPGVADPARYIRLPLGWNSKPAYVPDGSEPPAVKLLAWRPQERVHVAEFGCKLLADGDPFVDWRATPMPVSAQSAAQLGASGALTRCADLNNPEPLMLMAQELGMNPVQVREGVVEAVCPNVAEHTQDGREGTGFAFLGNGLMECQHGHCQHLSTPGFKQMMMEQFDNMVAGQIALGIAPPARDAGEFLAREEFRRHGGLDDAGAAADAAEAMAGRQSDAAEARADAEAALAHRFVWIAQVGLFCDTKDRSLYSPSLFNSHPDVVKVIPVGASGAKAANNIILNRADRRDAAGLCYRPGEDAAVVEAENDKGVLSPHVNMWTPSRVGRRPGTPAKWLEVVAHLVPDKTFREFLLNWLAWVVQNPTSRTPLIPVIVSGQGAGKDTLLDPFIAVLGSHNSEQLTPNRLASEFNDWQRKRLLVLTEVRLDAGGKAYNKIKALTGTGQKARVKVNEKGKAPYDMEFMGVFIAMTNEREALKGMEHDDRRFAPYISPAERLDAVWGPADHAVLGSDAELERVHEFLMERDLSAFNPFKPPEDATGARAEVLSDSLSAPSRAVLEALINGEFRERVVVSFSEVMHHVQSSDPSPLVRNHLTHANVRQGMLAAGCIPCHGGKLVRVGDQRERIYTGALGTVAERRALSEWTPKDLSRKLKEDVAEADKRRMEALGVAS